MSASFPIWESDTYVPMAVEDAPAALLLDVHGKKERRLILLHDGEDHREQVLWTGAPN